jgi:hypothetical protein
MLHDTDGVGTGGMPLRRHWLGDRVRWRRSESICLFGPWLSCAYSMVTPVKAQRGDWQYGEVLSRDVGNQG